MAAARLRVERTITVHALPDRVLTAFFEPEDLAKWWKVTRSVTVARPLGTYALEWARTEIRDELLGYLGGAFHGTVMEYRGGHEFFVAEAYWNPPDGDPIGPMALEVQCITRDDPMVTDVTVRLSGPDEGPRWQRYFHVISTGWQHALLALKQHLESDQVRSRP